LTGRSSAVIFTGGRIHVPGSAYGTTRQATAVAVRDDKIIFVGDDEGARRSSPQAAEVDLGGRLVTPAFVDAHVHLIQAGLVMNGLDLHGVPSRARLLAAVADFARQHPQARVIVGQGWDERGWPEAEPPTRAELDRAAGAVPVYLARVDVHSAVVSTALLDQLPGLTALEGYRADGLLTRDAHHRCRGQLDRLFSDRERRAAAEVALQVAASQGVATLHELGGPHLGPLEDLNRVREVAAEAGLGIVCYWGELAGAASIRRARAAGAAGLAGDLCIDGAIGSRTAALRDAYADGDSRGARYLSQDEISDHLVACTRAGLQGGFHCIGDDAVAAAVEGLRQAARLLGPERIRAARHRLEHLEMVSGGDLETLTALGVVASVQPAFDAAWGRPGELYEQRLGPDRAAAMNPFGSLERHGVPLAFGTDAPVTPLTGWGMVRDAVQHSRAPERMTLADAFDAATRGAHWAAFADRAGLIAAGWQADLAIWDFDSGQLDPASGLPDLAADAPLPECAATVAAGTLVHQSPNFSAAAGSTYRSKLPPTPSDLPR
jgi:predicted amidohydrolase YtcJ